MAQAFNRQLMTYFGKLLIAILTLLLIFASFSLMAPTLVFAEPSTSLEITGDGVTTPVEFTLAELEAMEQYQHVYSTVNTWPTKRWYTARGVKLRELLTLAGIREEAKLIKFISNDGYDVTLTVKELLKDKRYYFPGLKDNHPSDGSIPGSPEGAREVEPILALVSAEGSDNPENMNERDSLLLIFGQRAVTEQTNNLFLKYVSKIEVLTAEPEKWDSPKANVPSGTVVPEGFMLTLENKRNNEDKIYYTTDGSTPTVNSPMFNWSASRWWPLRDDLDSVNKPIKITKDTVIKAITIGPGKEDSEVVTFTFTVDPQAVDPTKVPGGPPTGVTLDRNSINLKPGGTFQLAATVAPFNADDQRVTWSSSDTSVATVDTRGLVTVVGTGTATITVRTVAGNHTATCIVNSSGEEDRSQEAVLTGSEPPGSGVQGPGDVTDAPAPALKTFEEVPGTPNEPPPDKQPAGEPPAHELPVPEGKGRYLAAKKDLADAFTGDSLSEQPVSASWQVFEMSLAGGAPLLFQEEQKRMGFYTSAIFLLLFLSGAGKKYAEYTKEL